MNKTKQSNYDMSLKKQLHRHGQIVAGNSKYIFIQHSDRDTIAIFNAHWIIV